MWTMDINSLTITQPFSMKHPNSILFYDVFLAICFPDQFKRDMVHLVDL